jgi:hypothetical protein
VRRQAKGGSNVMSRSLISICALLVVAALAAHAGLPGSAPPRLAGNATPARLLPADGSAGDHFGESVAISGGIVVIGAPRDDEGLDIDRGSVYVFVLDRNEWSEEARILAEDGVLADALGMSVTISGESFVAGAPFGNDGFDQTGSAYVFVPGRRGWEEQGKLLAGDGEEFEQFGYAVAMDGDTVAVGAYLADGVESLSGAAYVFERSRERWSETQKLLPSEGDTSDRFGFAASVMANTALVGAPFAIEDRARTGAAFVFVRDRRGRWQEQDRLVPSDGRDGDQFGTALATTSDVCVIGSPGAQGTVASSGAAYLFAKEGDRWREVSKIYTADGLSGDAFGSSVSLSGDYIVIGAPGYDGEASNSGAAYFFVRTNGAWLEREMFLPARDYADALFGTSVAVSGGNVLVGAPGEMDNGPDSGVAYVFGVNYLFTLTVTREGTGSGLVWSEPPGIDCGVDCSESFTIDTQVTLTAEPDADSAFVGWNGEDDCADGFVTMRGDLACTARFDLRPHLLTIVVTGPGSGRVTSDPAGIDCGQDCTETYPAGTEVSLTAQPDPDMAFGGWLGEPDCSDGLVTMTGDRSCEAQFLSTFVFGDGFESGDTSLWE